MIKTSAMDAAASKFGLKKEASTRHMLNYLREKIDGLVLGDDKGCEGDTAYIQGLKESAYFLESLTLGKPVDDESLRCEILGLHDRVENFDAETTHRNMQYSVNTQG